jgi:tRNA A37 threonylcarbamoyltransferase TsaD
MSMSLRQQLLQIPSLLLVAIRDNTTAAFDASFSDLASTIAGAVRDGSASEDDLVLKDKIAAAVEAIASSFISSESSEEANIQSIQESIATKLGSSLHFAQLRSGSRCLLTHVHLRE